MKTQFNRLLEVIAMSLMDNLICYNESFGKNFMLFTFLRSIREPKMHLINNNS